MCWVARVTGVVGLEEGEAMAMVDRVVARAMTGLSPLVEEDAPILALDRMSLPWRSLVTAAWNRLATEQ